MRDEYPLLDSDDLDIIMHREAHFGGDFPTMLEYYCKEGKGALLDSDRVEELVALEQQLEENLATILLSAEDLKKIVEVRETYQHLRSLYELSNPKSTHPKLLADLILCEEEEEEEAVAAIVREGKGMVPHLIRLLQSPQATDPLYPGYGFAAGLAARCLGLLASSEAIIPLFETIGHPDGYTDQEAIDALVHIGAEAKTFLLLRLRSTLSADIEKSAAALSAFPPDEEIGRVSLALLHNFSTAKKDPLSSYLAICCAGLKSEEDLSALRQLVQTDRLSVSAREEIEALLRATH